MAKKTGTKTAKKRKSAEPEHDLLTMPEAIDRLKTTRATFYRWLKDGKIQGVKVGRQWRFAREQIDRFLSGEEPGIDLSGNIGPLHAQLNERYRELTGGDFETAGDVCDAVSLMMHLAAWMRASGIHISPRMHADPTTPSETEVEQASVRFRVDGVLHPVATFDLRLLPVIISRWKILAKCDVRECILPQDGRITVRVGSDDSPERPLDIRVSFLPAALGECLTARLLDREAVNISLDRLGFEGPDLDKLRRGLSAPNGFILVTGPTGCGKTTTLYACLNEIVNAELKVMSVEDPVEYLIPGVVQTPIRSDVGLTFPVAIRSMLRSDPDAVLVGEIRDLDTLQACFQMSLSGHLVLSTLHTPTAAAGLERMVNVGSEPYLVGATARLVMAQRLVRRLCAECGEPSPPEGDQVDRAHEMLHASGAKWSDFGGGFRKAVGCPQCGHTGYHGRMALVEVLEMSPEIDRAVRHGLAADELQAIAVGQGMTTMAADGIRKAVEGVTTLEEVLRVLALR